MSMLAREIAETAAGAPAGVDDLRAFATRIRTRCVELVARTNASHIGTCLSMADIVAALYGRILCLDPRDPAWSGRDRFILSKGHGGLGVYVALAERGFFDPAELEDYSADGSRLLGHVSHGVPGVEVSTGSLGHGLPIGAGMALAAKRAGLDHRVFVILGDGEMDEGSNWEAILFAQQHGLDNLVAIIDCNDLQGLDRTAEILDLEPLADKLRAFTWSAAEIDGNDMAALVQTLERVPAASGRPTAVIARTTKGKGVSYMEDQLAWHYRSPDAELLARALADLGTAIPPDAAS